MPYEPEPGEDALGADRLAFRGDREVRHTVIRVIGTHLRPSAKVSWQGLDYDFTGVVFDGGDFANAQFSGGMVSFSGAEFSGGTVSFSGARFSGAEVNLRQVCQAVAVAVAREAFESGVARAEPRQDIDAAVRAAMWSPRYPENGGRDKVTHATAGP